MNSDGKVVGKVLEKTIQKPALVEEKTPIRKAWEATENAVGETIGGGINAVISAVSSPFMSPSDKAAMDKNNLDAVTARQMKYQEGVQQQERAVAQNTAQKTGRPIVKPAPTPVAAPATVAGVPAAPATAPPVGPPAPPAPPAPARTYDFESGEGKELTGIVNGRKTYTKASELYGPAKPSIPNTIAATPATADATKPVMIQGQSIDQQRADHQARNQNVAAADRAMSSTTAISPIAQPSQNITRPAIPRGPASQPIQTSYKRNDPTVDQGAVDKYLSAVKDSHNYGGTDEEYNRRKAAPEEISKASNEVTRLKMGGALALQGIDKAIEKPKPQAVSQRVVSQRPATAEELRTRRVAG